MESFYLVALTSGFFGGLSHCTYMCGPIISSVFMKHEKVPIFKLFIPQVLYHSGRIFTYSLIGFAMGYTGSFINVVGSFAGIPHLISLLMGFYLLIKGLEMLNLLPIEIIKEFFQKIDHIGFRFSGLILSLRHLRSDWKYFIYGLILGFLPCGLSYTAFIASSGLEDPFKGFLFMFIFGIANIPSLELIVTFSTKIYSRTRSIFYYTTGVIFIAFGLYYLLFRLFNKL